MARPVPFAILSTNLNSNWELVQQTVATPNQELRSFHFTACIYTQTQLCSTSGPVLINPAYHLDQRTRNESNQFLHNSQTDVKKFCLRFYREVEKFYITMLVKQGSRSLITPFSCMIVALALITWRLWHNWLNLYSHFASTYISMILYIKRHDTKTSYTDDWLAYYKDNACITWFSDDVKFYRCYLKKVNAYYRKKTAVITRKRSCFSFLI